MDKNLSRKPMVVIDLQSGSFVANRTGHEFFNRRPNIVDGRYYGYCPPHDDLRIERLGAKADDESVSGVIVVYTTKYRKTSNRIIVAFTDDATIHRERILDPSLHRTLEEDGKLIDCTYSIESDNIYNLDDYPVKFIIPIADYSKYMFRKQRFYKGKYPALDRKIIAYLDQYLNSTVDEDSPLFQRQVQEEEVSEGMVSEDNSKTEPEFMLMGGSKVVNKKARASKSALVAARFLCAVDPGHKTFLTEKGTPYMEGHHLIPCTYSNAVRFRDERQRNIDCTQNIVCLCPTCHRRVHFGSKEEKEAILKHLYDKQLSALKKAGLDISFKKLCAGILLALAGR